MSLKIDKDHNRFKEIIKGHIKKDLKKYVSNGELIGKKGKDLVSIPVPRIDIPHFIYSHKKVGGVGQGEGKPGTPLGGADGDEQGVGQAGDAPGAHILEVDITLDDLAKILGEELVLPRIKPKGKKNLNSAKEKYTGIHVSGPESLRHFKRTYKEALKRQLISGGYDPHNPRIIPIREDKRFRSWKVVNEPASNAVIFYIMDVSGSMGMEQKEIVRTESFWIDTWLRSQYKGLEFRYIIHDATAREVDSETFYHTRESGGTIISSAYKLCQKIMLEEYSPQEWNIYIFHFSDGDNWSGEDTASCISLLKEQVLPGINLFCYGQVESQYGTGQFLKDLQEGLTGCDNMALSKIESKEDILDSIRTFLGKGEIMDLTPDLAAHAKKIAQYAREYGLDFYETVFELLDFDELNQVASYGGFPTRYPHWRFGMEYEQLSKGYSYGLSKIYELVINNDPCYAYLMKSNAVTDQKLVMAHVYGHCDFFKNNQWFSKTHRKMMDEIANHATRIRRYIDRLGHDRVESFIDVCLSLENLIDYHSPFVNRSPKVEEAVSEEYDISRIVAPKMRSKDYMDRYINPAEYLEAQKQKIEQAIMEKRGKFPQEPVKDVLDFLIRYAPLERWQRDVLSIIREEAYYFAPQGQTKIMNEGWATYWHSKMMTERILTDAEVIDYADHHSGTLGSRPGSLNPYKVGLELMRDIEDRWNKGRFGKEYDECDNMAEKNSWDKKLGRGREKIFEVRKIYNDVTFIDTFLTADFCRNHGLFTYAYNYKSGQYEISDRDFNAIKQKLLFSLTNFGQPIIYVEDANFKNRGELYLEHHHEGADLRLDWAKSTLENLFKIWQRPVNLLTAVDGKQKIISYDGTGHSDSDAIKPK